MASFVSAQSPEPRRKLRLSIRALADGGRRHQGVDGCSGRLPALARGAVRIIYREAFEKGGRVVKCLFAERRAVVYELFTELVVSDLT